MGIIKESDIRDSLSLPSINSGTLLNDFDTSKGLEVADFIEFNSMRFTMYTCGIVKFGEEIDLFDTLDVYGMGFVYKFNTLYYFFSQKGSINIKIYKDNKFYDHLSLEFTNPNVRLVANNITILEDGNVLLIGGDMGDIEDPNPVENMVKELYKDDLLPKYTNKVGEVFYHSYTEIFISSIATKDNSYVPNNMLTSVDNSKLYGVNMMIAIDSLRLDFIRYVTMSGLVKTSMIQLSDNGRMELNTWSAEIKQTWCKDVILADGRIMYHDVDASKSSLSGTLKFKYGRSYTTLEIINIKNPEGNLTESVNDIKGRISITDGYFDEVGNFYGIGFHTTMRVTPDGTRSEKIKHLLVESLVDGTVNYEYLPEEFSLNGALEGLSFTSIDGKMKVLALIPTPYGSDLYQYSSLAEVETVIYEVDSKGVIKFTSPPGLNMGAINRDANFIKVVDKNGYVWFACNTKYNDIANLGYIYRSQYNTPGTRWSLPPIDKTGLLGIYNTHLDNGDGTYHCGAYDICLADNWILVIIYGYQNDSNGNRVVDHTGLYAINQDTYESKLITNITDQDIDNPQLNENNFYRDPLRISYVRNKIILASGRRLYKLIVVDDDMEVINDETITDKSGVYLLEKNPSELNAIYKKASNQTGGILTSGVSYHTGSIESIYFSCDAPYHSSYYLEAQLQVNPGNYTRQVCFGYNTKSSSNRYHNSILNNSIPSTAADSLISWNHTMSRYDTISATLFGGRTLSVVMSSYSDMIDDTLSITLPHYMHKDTKLRLTLATDSIKWEAYINLISPAICYKFGVDDFGNIDQLEVFKNPDKSSGVLLSKAQSQNMITFTPNVSFGDNGIYSFGCKKEIVSDIPTGYLVSNSYYYKPSGVYIDRKTNVSGNIVTDIVDIDSTDLFIKFIGITKEDTLIYVIKSGTDNKDYLVYQYRNVNNDKVTVELTDLYDNNPDLTPSSQGLSKITGVSKWLVDGMDGIVVGFVESINKMVYISVDNQYMINSPHPINDNEKFLVPLGFDEFLIIDDDPQDSYVINRDHISFDFTLQNPLSSTEFLPFDNDSIKPVVVTRDRYTGMTTIIVSFKDASINNGASLGAYTYTGTNSHRFNYVRDYSRDSALFNKSLGDIGFFYNKEFELIVYDNQNVYDRFIKSSSLEGELGFIKLSTVEGYLLSNSGYKIVLKETE